MWELTSNGDVMASGTRVTTTNGPVVVHKLAGYVQQATPKRESHVELFVDGVRVAGGPARADAYGMTMFRIVGAGWRLEASA